MADQPLDISQLTKSPSLAALRVSLRSTGDIKFSCSGFLWKRDDDLYLVTNWHCVTGWHPIKNEPLSTKGFWPEIAVLPIIVRNNSGKNVWREVTLKLRTDREALWFQHPSFGRRVDVAAVKLPALIGVELLSLPVNNVPQNKLKFMVADDAFVLGFPDIHTGGFPIWKRASLATEPLIDHDDLPKVLVDTGHAARNVWRARFCDPAWRAPHRRARNFDARTWSTLPRHLLIADWRPTARVPAR